MKVVSHQVVFHQGGLLPGGLSSGWSFVKVVSHEGGLAAEFSLSVLCAGS